MTEEFVLPARAIRLVDPVPGDCRSCGARIAWVVSGKTGKRAPIDPDGTSHFATCPQAETWRKKK